MKGNLIISCPDTRQGPSKAVMRKIPDGSRNEWPQEMCSRLIREKTGCIIPPGDMTACHQLGFSEKKKNSWVIRVVNRSPGSGWEALSAGMVSGKRSDNGIYFNQNDGIYLNYMLEPVKSDLLWQVRMLRKKGLVSKYSVNQNGRIMFLKEKSPRSQPGQQQAKEPWVEVKDLKTLSRTFQTTTFPIQK